MKLQHIELSELKVSPVNVRKRGAGEDLGELIASIRSLGVIQPLLVRPNCEGYEVVAGQRRLLACQALQEETGGVAPLPCALLENGDDATALEASLAPTDLELVDGSLKQILLLAESDAIASLRSALLRPQMKTAAPAFVNRSAIMYPIPFVPPVTTAVLPARSTKL